MLGRLIACILLDPVLSAAWPLHGVWSSSLGWAKPFFFLLPLYLLPGLVLAAPIFFSLEGALARRVGPRRFRVLVAVGCSLAYALLSGATCNVAELGPDCGWNMDTMLTTPLVLLMPITAFGLFGFYLPSIACGAYVTFAERPRWWVAGLLGTGTLIVGTWLWILLGVLVGAPGD